MNLNEVYKRVLKEKLTQDDTLFILQGFPFEVYEAVQEFEITHLLKKKYSQYIDYRELDKDDVSRELLMAIMTLKGSAWIFYEEFISLSNIINNFTIYSGNIVLLRNNLFGDYYPIPVKVDIEKTLNLYEKENAEENIIFKYYSDCKLINGQIYFSYVNRHYDIDTGIKIDDNGMFNSIELSYELDEKCEKIALSSLTSLKNKIQTGSIENKKYIVTEHSSTLEDELKVLNYLGQMMNVLVIPAESKRDQQDGNRHLETLKKFWGREAEFRYNPFYKEPEISSETIEISQGEIVSDIIYQCESGLEGLEYSDLIVTAPTGAGKSLLFQIPSIYLYEQYKAITIVICPLVALMVDQVKELNDRGVSYATFINSSITFEERKERLDGIKNGRYSIVYLSPELLLSSDIHSIIGERKVGLFVVDEAHLVTSWGRDFRVDYWFLGDYLEKVRHGSYYSNAERVNVPILCLTATGVFGGNDDVIGDLQNSLQLVCNSEQLYIGYVRRNNIEFIIRHPKRISKSDKEEKISLTAKEVAKSIDESTKTIVYFPFKSSIEDTWNRLKDNYSGVFEQVVKYHSGPDIGTIEKNDAYMNFRDNEKIIMLSTKAFGMGVNIGDVKEVYHFAPTGTLADYVQEIGRAARKLNKGYAVTDFLPTDMHYARTLWGLSGVRHYQIQEMIKKLYELYSDKKRRNLLISPDTFNYLFDNSSIEMKVKSGLMLLSTDLLDKYHFKVIAVRAKSLFSKQYITVPATIDAEFLKKYQKYCTVMADVKPRLENNRPGYESISYKVGNVYEINLAALWEMEFSDMTFPKFKFDFFNGKLFSLGDENIVPNARLTINYSKGYDEIKDGFKTLADVIQKTFNAIKLKFGGREFKLKDFFDIFSKHYETKMRKEYIAMLLDLFCYDHIDLFEIPSENWKFIERRKSSEELMGQMTYCIRTQKYAYIGINLKKYFNLAKPNQTTNNSVYTTYIPISRQSNSEKGTYLQLLASILQLFEMATYELNGGRNPEIFVRINDPQKLKRIASSDKKYNNRILTEIEGRHKRAVKLMNQFMMGEYTNEDRWKIIEEYFLGHDEVVDEMLLTMKLSESSNGEKKVKKLTEKPKNVEVESFDVFSEYYTDWEEATEVEDVTVFIENHISMPEYFNAILRVGEKRLDCQYVWKEKKLAVVEDNISEEVSESASIAGWCLMSRDELDKSEIVKKMWR